MLLEIDLCYPNFYPNYKIQCIAGIAFDEKGSFSYTESLISENLDFHLEILRRIEFILLKNWYHALLPLCCTCVTGSIL